MINEIYGPYRLYTPKKDMSAYHLAQEISAQFLCDKDGNDWYESQKQLAEHLLKIAINDNGVIFQASRDISSLWPIDLSVVAVSDDCIPANFDPLQSDQWQYRQGAIYTRQYTNDELIAEVEFKKQRLLAEAAKAIAPLQDAIDIGEATTEEEMRLRAWKKYRVSVSRIKSELLPTSWPEKPDL